MIDSEVIVTFLVKELGSITGRPASEFSGESRLVGSEAVIQSRELVELLLSLEEYLEEKYKVRFDWTSDSAMSETRSMLRSVRTLADHVSKLAV